MPSKTTTSKTSKTAETAETPTTEPETPTTETPTAETAETPTETAETEETPNVVAPFEGMAETDPPTGDAETVRGWLASVGRAAAENVARECVSLGYRLAQVLAFGQFKDSTEAWTWVGAVIGVSKSRGYDYLRAYNVVMETPSVSDHVKSVDGLVFLGHPKFTSEDRDMICTHARKTVGGELPLTVPQLMASAESLVDWYGEQQAKARERDAEREANRAALKAERDAAKTAKTAKTETPTAETAETAETESESDGAESDGAAINTDAAKTDRERQRAYDGLTTRNASVILSDAIAAAASAEPKDLPKILSDLFEQGLILGGAFGPQSVLAFRLILSEQRQARVTAENAVSGVKVTA